MASVSSSSSPLAITGTAFGNMVVHEEVLQGTYMVENVKALLEVEVENVKALLKVETWVLLQRQQLLYNGREMRNFEMLSTLDVRDEDFIMIVSNATSSAPINWFCHHTSS
ncbi:protein DNA-DAMAGE INDUCIBLE 1-like [Malus sylvestris]|uniref:protein DNA-DAMAGE INDUCIBLE 1-like n=1 Tax=Malus sylvestris TaxID=3752 RepID=UPI0021AD2753|nr:protein DNA-DAMAGE INDUCIBLE 1-like [Malus sylvestris]